MQVEAAKQTVKEKETALQTTKTEVKLHRQRFLKSVKKEATLKQQLFSLEADLHKAIQERPLISPYS